MTAGKARDLLTLERLVQSNRKEIAVLKSMIRDRLGYSSTEQKPVGVAAGTTGSSGAGFLKTEGDTMIGAIAFYPKLQRIDTGDNSIIVAPDYQPDETVTIKNAFSSRVVVSTAGGGTTLATIHGAAFAGQLLNVQGVLTETFNIVTTGNIRTFDGLTLTITDNQNIWMIYDSVAAEWAVVAGGGGTSAGQDPIVVDFINAKMAGDMTSNISVNNRIEFDTAVRAQTLTVTGGTGQAKGAFGGLLENHTYRLTAHVSVFADPLNVPDFTFQWYDIAGAALIGTHGNAYGVTGGKDETFGNTAEAIFTAQANTDTLEVRIVATSNVAGIFSGSTNTDPMTWVTIQDISGGQGFQSPPPITEPIITKVDEQNFAPASVTLDLSVFQHWVLVLDKNITITFSNPPGTINRSEQYVIEVIQDNVGGHTITWNDTIFPSAPSPATTANLRVILTGFTRRDAASTVTYFVKEA